MFRKFYFAAALACVALLAGGATAAETGLQRVTIRVSADIPPPPHPTALAMEWFKKQVEKTFPAGSQVRNFYAGALYKDADAMAAMGDGNLEMGWLMAGKTSSVDPWLGIIVQPGVLTTVAAVHDLGNLATGKMLLNRLRKKHGIEPFGFSDLSFGVGLAGQHRLLSLRSLKGRKIRTFAPAINPAVASWGANPVVMAFGEVPSAVQSGVLDGVVTTIGGWRSIAEQAPYFTIAGVGTITFDTYWVGASQSWWKKLNAPTQKKLRQLVNGAIQYQNEANWCNDQFSIQRYHARVRSSPASIPRRPSKRGRCKKRSAPALPNILKKTCLQTPDHGWIAILRRDVLHPSEPPRIAIRLNNSIARSSAHC